MVLEFCVWPVRAIFTGIRSIEHAHTSLGELSGRDYSGAYEMLTPRCMISYRCCCDSPKIQGAVDTGGPHKAELEYNN